MTHFKGRAYFIGKRFSPDALTTLALASGIASLNHEASYVTVEYASIVVVGGTQCEKVLGFPANQNMEFDLEPDGVPLQLLALPRKKFQSG